MKRTWDFFSGEHLDVLALQNLSESFGDFIQSLFNGLFEFVQFHRSRNYATPDTAKRFIRNGPETIKITSSSEKRESS
jgi:hypothetical protein